MRTWKEGEKRRITWGEERKSGVNDGEGEKRRRRGCDD